MGTKRVFDIEADELLIHVTKMHVLVSTDPDTGESNNWLEGDLGWQKELENASEIIGHNIVGYDLLALEKLYGWKPPSSVKITDTLILSQVLNYNRFGPHSRHGLESWGRAFGFEKIEFNDFSVYTPQMLTYCERDVDLNVKVYKKVLKELENLAAQNPRILDYIAAEHYAHRFTAIASWKGWPFDTEKAYTLFEELTELKAKAESVLTERLGLKVIPVDKCKGIVAVKEPTWTKQGKYNHHLAAWFDIDPWSGFPGEVRMVEGPYCRVVFEPRKLSSPADVKDFLFEHGWIPDEWNYKKDARGNFEKDGKGNRVKSSPKISDESLELLGGDGKLYTDYKSASARYAILNTWLEEVDSEDLLHGDCFGIGTPSMRARHSIIVNVPSVQSFYGKEMRELFRCPPGWKIIGADSSGNQARGLAHYLKNDEFTDILINGDIHIYDAEKIIAVLNTMGVKHEFTPKTLRPRAKRILYAFLFGAGGDKLWSYIFGNMDSKKGNVFKKLFTNAVPGFANLIEKLNSVHKRTKRTSRMGYIPSIAGNRIYVDSPHKLLVYLLQAMEKVTCTSAIMFTMQQLEKENIPYQPLIFMHDEEQFMVPDEYAERAGEISSASFREAPKLYGVDIMDGTADIGMNWYDTH